MNYWSFMTDSKWNQIGIWNH